MNGFPNRRLTAAAAATLALVVGGIGAGSAGAQGGSMSTPAPITSHAGLSSGLGLGVGFGLGGSSATPGAGLPGLGLFKALFALFGAVRTAVPTIAAPIVAQAVTAGTITPAEADQLTGLLSGKHAAAGAMPTKPSAAEITVLHSVIAAVLGQLPTIAAPVLATEVTAGDLTQAQAEMITRILTGLAAIKAPAMSGLTTHAGGGMLATSLASKVTAQVKKHVKVKHKHARAHSSR
jgi:hypothetical protein